MTSRSYTNLLDLATGIVPTENRFKHPHPATKSEFSAATNSVASDATSSIVQVRIIIVANQLPLQAHRRPDNTGWMFSWDEDSLVLQLKDGLSKDLDVRYVGSLKVEVDPCEQDEVAHILLQKFKCVPVFLPDDIYDKFYLGFCKQQLWPLFHYMLPLTTDSSGRFDESCWHAYVSANKMFADKVIEMVNSEDDFVWIHDYHLMALPNFLRRRLNRLKMGFFLHSPFPSSEIYRALPVREDILRALLNTDLIGFHTFDYARHFLSCCSRMLGLEYQSKRGYIELEYYGRTVGIKILPVGIHMGQVETVLRLADKEWRVNELMDQLKGKTVVLGVDDMDIFKGINLKVLAMEQLLVQYPKWRNKIVLVQIVNPARGKGRDIEELQAQISSTCHRINEAYGSPEYTPILLIERSVPIYERIAYYTIAECVVVTAVRDGLNLVPYEYIISREAGPENPKKSMIVVSEFVGCSPSLSGAIRVNPWNTESVADAINMAISMPEAEKQLRHEKHYRYVSTHDVAFWARSFMQDLERSCRDHQNRRCWQIGFGMQSRVVSLDPSFQKLSIDDIQSAYTRTKSRVILLDYDGTMMPESSIDKRPSPVVIHILNKLCADPKNMVFIVSGRGKESLSNWFSPCEKLGIAAEHGYFLRWSRDEEWVTCCDQPGDFSWLQIAEPVMQLYAETTDGSWIETKESAIVWHHQDADPDFGSCQAKELLDHLENVLANEPVLVKRGQHIVEVKPQGVSKGSVAEKLLAVMAGENREPDFVLCIGDDRSDEDMFEVIRSSVAYGSCSSDRDVFACTVGQKPSKAKYYVDDTIEVRKVLEALVDS